MGTNGLLLGLPHRHCVASGRTAVHRGRRRAWCRVAMDATWSAGMIQLARCGSRCTRALPGPSRHRPHRSLLRDWGACKAWEVMPRRGSRAPRHLAMPHLGGTTRWTHCLLQLASTQSQRTGGRCHLMQRPGRSVVSSATTTLRRANSALKTQTDVRMKPGQAGGPLTPMRG